MLMFLIINTGLQAASAEDFKTMFMREGSGFVETGGAVLVIFHTNKPLSSTLATISAAMKSSNPDAIINKTWITDIAFRGIDSSNNCGLVIGKWAYGAIESEWESVIFNKVRNLVNSITFQYAKKGTLKTLVGTVGSEGNDLMEICGLQ